MSMTLISTVTVGAGGAASIDFTSIPGTYTDLLVVASLRGNGGATQRSTRLRVNNDSSGIYTERMLQGDGSSASSASNANDTKLEWGVQTDTNATANTFSNISAYIPNYAGSTYKSVSRDSVGENNGTFSLLRLTAGVIGTTSPITSLSLIGEASLVQYSSASLYGITKGSGGATVA